MSTLAARVAGMPVSVEQVNDRETRLRASIPAESLPLPDSSEGRQLRRWLTQLIVTEEVVAAEAERLGVCAADAPGPAEVLPDAAARHELGSIAAAALADPLARALFAHLTAHVTVGEDEVADYHARNPMRFAEPTTGPDGWAVPPTAPSLEQVRPAVVAHLLAAARRSTFRIWLDARRADLVELSPGYEHPGDPRQPDNVHRH